MADAAGQLDGKPLQMLVWLDFKIVERFICKELRRQSRQRAIETVGVSAHNLIEEWYRPSQMLVTKSPSQIGRITNISG